LYAEPLRLAVSSLQLKQDRSSSMFCDGAGGTPSMPTVFPKPSIIPGSDSAEAAPFQTIDPRGL